LNIEEIEGLELAAGVFEAGGVDGARDFLVVRRAGAVRK
jgi:hypothetical protein